MPSHQLTFYNRRKEKHRTLISSSDTHAITKARRLAFVIASDMRFDYYVLTIANLGITYTRANPGKSICH